MLLTRRCVNTFIYHSKRKAYNDYGFDFYCTKDIEMAKEWGCGEQHDRYANIYEIDATGLKILNLNTSDFTILHWLTILLKNPIVKDAKNYLIENFSVDTSSYDFIVGY